MLPIIANYWPLCISSLIACIVAACFMTMTIELYARRQKENDNATIKVSILAGLISYTFKLPKMILNGKGIGIEMKGQGGTEAEAELDVKKAVSQYQTRAEAFEIIKEFKPWFITLMRKTELSDWSWHSRAGTGEAMSSALSCGMLWSAKGVLFGTISRYVKVMNAPSVSIVPLFQQKWFSTEWSCTLRLKLGSMLVASVYLLFHFAALRRGVLLWKTFISKV